MLLTRPQSQVKFTSHVKATKVPNTRRWVIQRLLAEMEMALAENQTSLDGCRLRSPPGSLCRRSARPREQPTARACGCSVLFQRMEQMPKVIFPAVFFDRCLWASSYAGLRASG